MTLDVSKLSTADKVIAGTGIGILVASFLPWIGVKGVDETGSGWDEPLGMPVKLAVLLALAAAVWVLVRASGTSVQMPVGPALLTLVLAGLALLFLVYQILLDWPSVLGFKFSREIGAWLALLLSIAQTVYAFLTFKESGEAIPGVNTGSGTSGSAAAMPPTGYAAPQPPPPPAASDPDYPPPPAE